MNLGTIKQYKEALQEEELSIGAMIDIHNAFHELVESGVQLRDLEENALASDMLDELEEHAPKVEMVIYEWVKKHFGEGEANDPSWSTYELAKEISNMEVGAARLGYLLGEL